MNFLTAKTRITIGLMFLLISLMVTIVTIGVGPNERLATMRGRAQLAESIAIDCSIHLNKNQIKEISALLESLVRRNPEVISAAVRHNNGRLRVEINDHQARWESGTVQPLETHAQIPLQVGKSKWGQVEILFRPIQSGGWISWLTTGWSRYILMVGTLAFFVIYFYLGFVLRQLDPSKAVPKRVRAALDTLAEGLILTDAKGRVILANEAFAAWAGKDAEKLVGHDAAKFPWIFEGGVRATRVSPEQLPWMRAIAEESAQARWMMQLNTGDGNELTLVANASPIIGTDGRYRGVLTSFEDVTELEQHKVELSEAKTAADEANRAKSEFLARMSHEIRTPMNAILGYTEVLRNGYDQDESRRRQHLATIQSSGEHLLALINDILDLSKVESGQMELELRHCSIHKILMHVISVLGIKAKEKGIELSCEADGLLPEAILTDEIRLQQTLINLVGNAIKFTEQGSVRMIARIVQRESRAMFAVDVVDTGIGMSPEQMEDIFDPFSQADTSITRRYGGTGLGLSICRQLVEKMGGEISVDSIQGQGSTFSITIDPGCLDGVPMIELASDQLVEDVDQVTSTATQIMLKDAHILVVDDGDSNRELVELLLKRSGAIVRSTENGQEAIAAIEQQAFDLVLMDMQMPIMDGFTATRELRRLGYEMPIVALTANVMHDDEIKCRNAGCDGFLAKPISGEHLLGTIAELLPGKVSMNPSSADPCLSEEIDGGEVRDIESIEHSLDEVAMQIGMDVPSNSNDDILSSLPIDDPDFRRIAEMFTGRLHQRVPLIRAAAESNNFSELADLAHWLKGAGGTAGFDIFTKPAADLQTAAESADAARIDLLVGEIEGYCRRIPHRPSETATP